MMKRLIIAEFLMVLFASSFVNSASTEDLVNRGYLIKETDVIKDAAAACKAVMDSIPDDRPMKDSFRATVVRLTRATRDLAESLKKGDVVWVVDVYNWAISELSPPAEGTFWVKAKDGQVFELIPMKCSANNRVEAIGVSPAPHLSEQPERFIRGVSLLLPDRGSF